MSAVIRLTQAAALAGRVTDARTKQPIAGAQVEIIQGPPAFQTLLKLAGPDRYRLTTRADGSYGFCDLPNGLYKLRASATNRYGSVETASVRVFKNRDDAGRIRVSYSNIALPPTRLHGKVTTGSGAPVSQAKVQVRGDTRSVLTDSGGEYTLDGLAPGTPTIEVSAAAFKTEQQTITVTTGSDLILNFVLKET